MLLNDDLSHRHIYHNYNYRPVQHTSTDHIFFCTRSSVRCSNTESQICKDICRSSLLNRVEIGQAFTDF